MSRYAFVLSSVALWCCAPTVRHVDERHGDEEARGAEAAPEGGASSLVRPADLDGALGERCRVESVRALATGGAQVLCLGEESRVLSLDAEGARRREVLSYQLREGRPLALRRPQSTDLVARGDPGLTQYTVDMTRGDALLLRWSVEGSGPVVAVAEAPEGNGIAVLVSEPEGVRYVTLTRVGASEPRSLAWADGLPGVRALGIWPGLQAEEERFWAVTADGIALGDLGSMQEQVPLPGADVVAWALAPSGPALLLAVDGGLHLLWRGAEGGWRDLAIAGGSPGPPGSAAGGEGVGGGGAAAACAADGALWLAWRSEGEVTLARLQGSEEAPRVLSLAGRAAWTRELRHPALAGGLERLFLDVRGGAIHVATVDDGGYHHSAVDVATFDSHARPAGQSPRRLEARRSEAAPGQPPSAEGTAEERAPSPEPACPEGQTRCAGRCTSLDSDGDNCGSCGNECPSGACHRGGCVAPCHRDSDCADGPGFFGGARVTWSCVPARRGRRSAGGGCPEGGRLASSCEGCTVDERCRDHDDRLVCCVPRSCTGHRSCRYPGSRCLAPDGGRGRRCLAPGSCVPSAVDSLRRVPPPPPAP